jgi:hypothetical protein
MSGIYCITVQDSLIFRCVTPGTLLQYASTGRITKSAEEPTSFTPVRHSTDWILPRKTGALDGLSIAPHATIYYIL